MNIPDHLDHNPMCLTRKSFSFIRCFWMLTIYSRILLITCIVGYILNYSLDMSDARPSTKTIILLTLIILSVRLLKAVLVLFLKGFWEPLVKCIDSIGKEQPVSANKGIIENLIKIDYETYLIKKRGTSKNNHSSN